MNTATADQHFQSQSSTHFLSNKLFAQKMFLIAVWVLSIPFVYHAFLFGMDYVADGSSDHAVFSTHNPQIALYFMALHMVLGALMNFIAPYQVYLGLTRKKQNPASLGGCFNHRHRLLRCQRRNSVFCDVSRCELLASQTPNFHRVSSWWHVWRCDVLHHIQMHSIIGSEELHGPQGMGNAPIYCRHRFLVQSFNYWLVGSGLCRNGWQPWY